MIGLIVLCMGSILAGGVHYLENASIPCGKMPFKTLSDRERLHNYAAFSFHNGYFWGTHAVSWCFTSQTAQKNIKRKNLMQAKLDRSFCVEVILFEYV